jgi:GAF domain-containing protein
MTHRRVGATNLVSGRSPKSQLMVPMLVNGQVRGMLTLNDTKREYAFSDSDVRLLETLAASMTVALENARLFDETQRLLKETEQRNAELAVINSIQHRMAESLNFRPSSTSSAEARRCIRHGRHQHPMAMRRPTASATCTSRNTAFA